MGQRPQATPEATTSRQELLLRQQMRGRLLQWGRQAVTEAEVTHPSQGNSESCEVAEDPMLLLHATPVPERQVVCAGMPPEDDKSEEAEVRRNVMRLHVMLLRIALRLGENPRSSIIQQVVYR